MKRKLIYLKKNHSIIIVITVIALIIRSINLGYLSLWVDEYVHAMRAINFLSDGEPIFTDDNNGILLTFFIIPLYKLFGHSEITTRLPSLIFGVATIPLIYLFAKRLFNKQVGIISGVILTFSLYHVFWSKIGRNYAIFMFFYLLAAYLLYLAFSEFKKQKKSIKLFRYLELNQKYLLFFFISFLLSFLSHQLSFFLIFSLGFFAILMSINLFFQKKSVETGEKKMKYLLIAVPAFVLFLGIFSETFGLLLKDLLLIMLPQNVVNWIIPNWDRLNQITKEDPYKIYDLYYNVVKTDFPKLYILAFFGFIISLFYNKKSGFFIVSFFIPIFLLMSFVFREPALPRYEIFIYPFAIISIAISLHFIYFKVLTRITSQKFTDKGIHKFIGILILLFLLPIKEVYTYTTTKKHGKVVDKKLSHWYFPDWKASAKKTANSLRPTDKIITTGIPNMEFYSGSENLIHYRQKSYSGKLHNYVPIDTKNIPYPHANSLEGIKEVIEKNDRVWLIVDYYFDGIFSDPQAKSYLINKMEYKPSYSNKDIRVFLYDKNNPKKRQNNILEILNKSKIQTQEYFINVQQLLNNQVNLNVDVEGLDFSGELQVIINKRNIININLESIRNKSNGFMLNLRNVYSIPIDKRWLTTGSNSFIFQYNSKTTLPYTEGVTLYNVSLSQ